MGEGAGFEMCSGSKEGLYLRLIVSLNSWLESNKGEEEGAGFCAVQEEEPCAPWLCSSPPLCTWPGVRMRGLSHIKCL